MKKIMTLLLLGVVGSSYGIIGGQAVNPNSNGLASSVVQIYSTYADGAIGVCSGVLVAPNKVLTAKHCVSHDHLNMSVSTEVYFGAQDNTSKVFVTKIQAPKNSWQAIPEIRVGNYSKDLVLADYAVLTLAQNAPAPHLPIKIANSIQSGAPIYSLGYGAIYDQYGKGQLSIAEMSIQEHHDKDVLVVYGDSKLPVDTPEGTKYVYPHTCPRDSGGPLVQYTDGGFELIAINQGYASTSDDIKPTCTDQDNLTMQEMNYIATDITASDNQNTIINYLQN